MRSIYKYELSSFNLTVPSQGNELTAYLPSGAHPIHVGLDPHGARCVWCEVQTGMTDKQEFSFWIVGTGKERPSLLAKYLGTVNEGPFMWHIYYQSHD
jgi:hypothetical protein